MDTGAGDSARLHGNLDHINYGEKTGGSRPSTVQGPPGMKQRGRGMKQRGRESLFCNTAALMRQWQGPT